MTRARKQMGMIRHKNVVLDKPSVAVSGLLPDIPQNFMNLGACKQGSAPLGAGGKEYYGGTFEGLQVRKMHGKICGDGPLHRAGDN